MPNKRWRFMVELTTDIKPGEEKYRALDRVKDTLETITGEGKELAHYHMQGYPDIVTEYD